MKKTGFTLAEVLITLGIIGVIAALTAPGLVMNSRNEANAAKLAVTMSNLENAFTSAIAQEGVDNLFRTRMWEGGAVGAKSGDAAIGKFVGRLGQYLHVNGYSVASSASGDKVESIKFYEDNGPYGLNANGGTDTSKVVESRMGSGFTIELKNGAVLFMNTAAEAAVSNETKNAIIDAGGSLIQEAASLWIDVNGKAGPNTHGRDIFHFYVGSNGILYPYGSMETAIFDSASDEGGISKTEVWNNASGDVTCLNGNIKHSGIGCVARLIAEGYKMNY